MSSRDLIVEPTRTGHTRSFTVRRDGKHLHTLNFRDIEALVATRAGHTRARLHRAYGSYSCIERLDPECDAYGVGYGTLWYLQRTDFTFEPLITSRRDEGLLALTQLGEEVLEAILGTAGVDLPPMLEAMDQGVAMRAGAGL